MHTPLPDQYMITDRKRCKDLVRAVKKGLERGVRLIQIREKDLSSKELYHLTQELKPLCQHVDAKLLINSNLDVALVLDLDGIHLPQQSLLISEVRLMLGPEKWIGKSTHTIKEAQVAEKQGANFITFGPLFETPSKKNLGKPLGLKKLEQVCQKVSIPVFALGGVNLTQLDEVKTLGAHGIAGIRTFLFSGKA